MRDIKRIEVITSKIQEYWKTQQNVRFGKILFIIVNKAKTLYDVQDVFFLEESVWEKVLDVLLENKIESATNQTEIKKTVCKLRTYWETPQSQDLRFGQIIAIIESELSRLGYPIHHIDDITEDIWYEILDKMINEKRP